MKDQFGDTAADIVFSNVLQISEDMLALVHSIISENSKYEHAFANMKAALMEIHKNLEAFVLKKKWIKGKNKASNKIHDYQTEELMRLCTEYSTKCHEIAEEMIKITEKIEKNRKMRDILKNLIARIDEKNQKNAEEESKEKGHTPDDEDEEEDKKSEEEEEEE